MPFQWDIEECHAFKVYGPPSGALTAFWTSEWNEHRQSTNVGAFVGRNVTQQRQSTVDSATANSAPQAMAGTVGELRSQIPARNVTQAASSSSQHASRTLQRQELIAALDSIAATASHYNSIMCWNFQHVHHAQRVMALQSRISSMSPPPQADSGIDNDQTRAYAQMQSALNHLLEAPLIPAPPAPPAVTASRGVPQDSHGGAAVQPPSVTAPLQEDRRVRPRHEASSSQEERSVTLAREMALLYSRFNAIELGGNGNCLFYVLQYLQNHDIPHETLSQLQCARDEDISLTRSRIADYLESRTAEGVDDPLCDPAGIALSLAMIDEMGSVQNYIAWIRGGQSSGGYIELLAWATLFKVRVQLFSTTIFSEALHQEQINWQVAAPVPVQTFHCLHHVGIGGVGGHYQLLQTILPAATVPQNNCPPATASVTSPSATVAEIVAVSA